MSKLEIALYATTFGWVLAQGTEYIRQSCRIKSKKIAIAEEMLELKMILSDGAETARTSALEFGKDGNIGFSLSSQLSSPVFDSFYHEVADKFTDWQRYNIRIFHSHLAHYNSAIDWVQKLKSGETTQNEIIFKLFEVYKQASFAVAYIEECDKNGGKIKMDDNHPKLQSLREQIEKDVEKLNFKTG